MIESCLEPDQQAAICAAYLAGASTAALAADYFVARETITRVLRGHGIPVRARGGAWQIPPDLYQQLKTRHHDGAPVAAIARDLGISRSAARRALKAAGDLRESFRG